MGAMASQITSLAIVYSTIYAGTDQRKHQSSASLAFVRGIHRWPVNFPHKWQVTRKMFPFDDIIMRSREIHPWHILHFQQQESIQPLVSCVWSDFPDSKVHGANMGPIWGRKHPGGPHVEPMNLVIRVFPKTKLTFIKKNWKFIHRSENGQLGPQFENCNNSTWALYLVHWQTHESQIGKSLWRCTTAGLEYSTELWTE